MERPSVLLRRAEDAVSSTVQTVRRTADETSGKVRVTAAEWKQEAERLLTEGKLRRIVVKHNGRILFQCHCFVGIAAALFAPLLTAAAGVIAVVNDCEIVLEVDKPKRKAAK